MGDQDFSLFIQKIRQKTGVDLTHYKEAQMKRRLTSLREKRGYSSFQTYLNAILKDQDLYAEFLDRMTINVSEFFRNPQRWEALERDIIPAMLSNNKTLKVWSAACSTGEEPYSLVLLLSRFLPLAQIRVKATDLDENAIARAKLGIYDKRSLKSVPNDLMQYFEQTDIKYKIKNQIIERVDYKKHNLLSDPFESGYDLIVCRNVMIYFTEPAKEVLYEKFSRALKPGGILFVGSTEQIFQPQQYSLESAGAFFYRKIS